MTSNQLALFSPQGGNMFPFPYVLTYLALLLLTQIASEFQVKWTIVVCQVQIR